MGFDLFKTISDGWNAAAGAVNDGWNAAAGAVNDGWNAVTKTAGDVYNAGAGFVESAANVAGSISNTLTKGFDLVSKYWYVPVIVGGVIVGYTLIKKNPAANAANIVKALAAAQN